MNTVKSCSKCGKAVPPGAPLGLCPECMMKAGLQTESRSTDTVDTGAIPAKWPVPGQQFGNYRIIRELGQGGMGAVYEAEQLESGRRLALKVISQGLTNEADVKRFLREGRLAAAISHPNVVYVFGSEEIEGNPVIAMELVTGGTLSDRVKQQGPVPAIEAVDTVLQLVAGLEAAQAAGVLHRDIKPHNCFVDSEGTVKIGDFGLSIPTQPRPESLITVPGSILGTPAYASPEQLRGGDLDVTSDIYSVGATLYYLLTGQAPFEGDDVVKLITAVLDRQPVSVKQLRPEIPSGLASIVMRCLAKDGKARFPGYDALRTALQPYSSAAPAPATLGLRFVAGTLDTFIAETPVLILMLVTGYGALDQFLIRRSLSDALVWGAFSMLAFLYYAVPEGLWGASVGKAICGLRVIGPDKHAPGLSRAFLRTLVFVLLPVLPSLLQMLWVTGEEHRSALQSSEFTFSDLGWVIAMLALFMTVRRRNGFAGLHELMSGTRVVIKPSAQRRPVLQVESEPLVLPELRRRLGPYLVVREEAGLALGYDEVLRRKVWIDMVPPGSPPLPAARRDLARAGRLRWLCGRRTDTENWDAFEAPEGAPFLELTRKPQPWAAVRFWLLDLAEEIHADQKDHSLPPLALDRIWITATGRAVLLDIPVAGQAEGIPVHQATQAQGFLYQMASKALRATSSSLSQPGIAQTTRRAWTTPIASDAYTPPPLHAEPFLENLRQGKLLGAEFIVANLRSLCDKVPTVSRLRRLSSLIFVPGMVAILGAFIGLMAITEARRIEKEWSTQHPELAPVWEMVSAFDYAAGRQSDQRAIGLQIGGRYRPIIEDSAAMEQIESKVWWEENISRRATKILETYPAPAEHEWRETEKKASELLAEKRHDEYLFYRFLGAVILPISLVAMGMLSFIFNLLFGVNPILRLLGIVVVNREGIAASRWRLSARTALAWLLPILLAAALLHLGETVHFFGLPKGPLLLLGVTVAVFAGEIVWMVLRPSRGPQEWLTGTWLVPR